MILAGVFLVTAFAIFGAGEIKTIEKPALECVDSGQLSSGFSVTKDDGTECALSSEYMQELQEYEWPAYKRPLRFVSVGLGITAIGLGVAGFVKFRKSKKI